MTVGAVFRDNWTSVSVDTRRASFLLNWDRHNKYDLSIYKDAISPKHFTVLSSKNPRRLYCKVYMSLRIEWVGEYWGLLLIVKGVTMFLHLNLRMTFLIFTVNSRVNLDFKYNSTVTPSSQDSKICLMPHSHCLYIEFWRTLCWTELNEKFKSKGDLNLYFQ